jgi:hypothetical protein
VKDIDILEIIPQIGPFIGAEDAQGKTDQGPDVHGVIGTTEMVSDIVNLGMAVVATGDAVVCSGGLNLLELAPAILTTLLGETGLEESAPTSAAVVVGTIGCHFDHVLGTNHRFDHETQVIGHWFAKALADDLTGILNGKLDSPILVPIAVDLQSSLTNPFRVILIDGRDFEVVLDVEFFQSGPD